MFTGCSRDPNVRKQKYLESGQRYFDKGRYREAAIQFENAIQVDPRFAEAHYRLALTEMKFQQWNPAFQELTTTLEIQPDNYKARLEIANLLVANRQLKDAKDHLDLLAQKQPNNPEVLAAIANYDAVNNDMGAALASMQKALQADPNRAESYLNMALLQIRAQQWDAAEASFKKAIALDPKSTNYQAALGNFYQSRGRFPEAEEQFKKAIEVAPAIPDARISLARLYVAENKPQQAEDLLKQAKKDLADNSVGYRMLGDFYFANGDIDKAVAEYASLYQEHAKDPVVKRNYIQLLILKDRLDEAKRLNDEVLKATPDDTDAQIYKGQIEIRSNNAASAVNTLQNVLKTDPENAVAHYQLGLAFDQLGNLTRAENEWREAVRIRPDIPEAHRALAGAAIHRSDTTALAQEADQIINLQPASPDGYLLRAIAEIDRKQFGQAENFIKQALAKQPNSSAAYVQLGNLRMAQNQIPQAQQAYQQGLDADPSSTDALGGILNVYLLQKQPDRALAAANAQLAKNPNDSAFHVILGRLLFEQKKDMAGAESEFKRALELDKNNTEARVQLGLVQNQNGSADQALQTYLDGTKVNSKETAFYLLAGSIYENRRDWDKARQVYQKVLELQPENPLASNNLAYVMLQQGGNVDVALAMAQTARRQLPDNPNSADTLGWAYYQKGVYSSAISMFKEALRLSEKNKEPESALYHYHLGLAYTKAEQRGLAKQQFERVLKIDPKSSDAPDARKQWNS